MSIITQVIDSSLFIESITKRKGGIRGRGFIYEDRRFVACGIIRHRRGDLHHSTNMAVFTSEAPTARRSSQVKTLRNGGLNHSAGSCPAASEAPSTFGTDANEKARLRSGADGLWRHQKSGGRYERRRRRPTAARTNRPAIPANADGSGTTLNVKVSAPVTRPSVSCVALTPKVSL